MSGHRWFVTLSCLLVGASALLYFGHFLIFHDPHHIFIYMIGDIAFVPLEVLLVTIIIHRLLEGREKKTRLEKINMVIGVFFTELGTQLLERLTPLYARGDKALDDLLSDIRGWDDERYTQALVSLKKISPRIRCAPSDLVALDGLLREKKEVLVRLLENPNLLEHENFTELLWSVTHVAEELGARKDLHDLTETDVAHLSGDVNRAFAILVREWVLYMGHLRKRYPYLFSFALRTNPFDAGASVEVT
ncbi:MAG: hypothetical protein JSV00_02570 [bacterium]|nr:MAG: hypothetical protein JSV00_02570 [bacterium]